MPSLVPGFLRREPQPSVRPAQDIFELLDATLSSADVSPELHTNASYLRSQILMDQFANADPLLKGLVAYGSTLNNAMTSSGASVGVNEFGALGRRQYVSDRRRLLELYRVVEACAEIQTAILHLRNEIFRRGMEWRPAFDYQCPECEQTYSKKEAREAEYRCQCAAEFGDELPPAYTDGVPLRTPDPHQLDRIKPFFKRANYFGQNLESVFRISERDVSIVDDAFIMLRKTYHITDEQETISQADPFDPRAHPTSEITDILRLDTTLIQFDLNDRGLPGRAHHLCLFHRATLLDIPQDAGWEKDWKGICPQCSLRTYPVFFTFNEQAAAPYSASRPVTIYLLEDEVIHWSRYSPSETYGWPALFSIYEKCLTLLGMDRYVYDYFFERRIPAGAVAIATSDTEDLRLQKKQTESEMMRNPHYIPWIAIDNRNGQATMQYVRFGYTLDEVDYLPLRDEIRERIAAMFGVSAVWMDSGGASGMSSQSEQIIVQSRVVEAAQRSYRIDVFEKLELQFSITDWELHLKTPEEANELASIEIRTARATWASMLAQMGFGIDYDEEEDRYTISGRVPGALEMQELQSSIAAIGSGNDLMQGAQNGMDLPTAGQSHPGPKTTPPPSDARQPHKQVLDSSLRTNGHKRLDSGHLQPLTRRNH